MELGNNLPISGGVIIAGILYAGISTFVTGPVIAERLIETSGWHTSCESTLKRNLISQRAAPTATPTAKCNAMLFWMGRDGRELCALVGNPDFGPLLDPVREQKRRLQEVKNKRLQNLAAQSGSRCSCAISTTLETKRMSFALYAGSARLITPNSIKNLNATLAANLNAPICAAFKSEWN